jgi:hypothetical protein
MKLKCALKLRRRVLSNIASLREGMRPRALLLSPDTITRGGVDGLGGGGAYGVGFGAGFGAGFGVGFGAGCFAAGFFFGTAGSRLLGLASSSKIEDSAAPPLRALGSSRLLNVSRR